MNTLPLFFNLNNKTVLIVGGGDIAYRKAQLMAKAKAKLVVIAKHFEAEFLDFYSLIIMYFFKNPLNQSILISIHPL